jgi:WbqC-like protein family
MIVSIHQPAYLPWLGYFDRIRQSDRFVFLDTVQFQKNSFQNRNRIRTATGSQWLTVPVETKGVLYSMALSELAINNRVNWRDKHIRSIRQNYAKAPFRDRVLDHLESVYCQPWDRLADLCWAMLQHFTKQFGLGCELIRASSLPAFSERKSALIERICRHLGADEYLSGPLGRGYLDEASFAAAAIAVRYHDYQHPAYKQAYPGFEPFMAAIDGLMNVDDAASLLRGGEACQ